MAIGESDWYIKNPCSWVSLAIATSIKRLKSLSMRYGPNTFYQKYSRINKSTFNYWDANLNRDFVLADNLILRVPMPTFALPKLPLRIATRCLMSSALTSRIGRVNGAHPRATIGWLISLLSLAKISLNHFYSAKTLLKKLKKLYNGKFGVGLTL